MKTYLFLVAILAFPVLAGCTDQDVDPPCKDVGSSGGCTSNFPYSCDGSANCYANLSACQVSNDCD